MSIKKIILLIGLCVLFTGCSTGGLNYSGSSTIPNTPTGKGERYLLGRGVQQDFAKAFTYFKQGAKENDPFAQNELAYLYASGKGTMRDNAQALYWYQKAADQGLSSAEYNLGLMYLYGMGTEPNKALGLEWIKKSADHGFEPAKQTLARSS